jgi:tetratricopeptide (TPR) repeat protein
MYSRAITLAPEDYMLWGSRADSLWFMEGRRDAAIEGYRRAIQLAEINLQVNDTEGITWALLAYYYNRVGDTDRAARYTERAMELHPDSPFVNYFAALAAADRGEIEESNRLAKLAVEYGFPMPLIMADPALPGMRTG